MSQFVQERLRGGLDFEARVMAHAAEIREQSKNVYGDALLHGRLQLLAIAEATYAAKSGEPGATSPSANDRLILIASFFQGVGATETLITEGQYAKAAAALKQDLEILTRVHETLQGVAKKGGTPNVKYAPTGAGRLYGQLNDVAHPSTPVLLAGFLGRLDEGQAHGVSYEPVFVEETALALYELHVWLVFEMCRELLRLMHDLYGDDPEFAPIINWWLIVAEQLAAGGHIGKEE